MPVSADSPGEVLRALLSGCCQRGAACGVVQQVGDRRRDVTRSDTAVRDRLATHLWQRQSSGGEHAGAARHGLEHRQAEALAERRVGDQFGAAEEARELFERQVARADHADAVRHRVQSPFHLAVPAGLTGEHQGRRGGAADHRLGEAPDQGRDVLARFQRAEERHVRRVPQRQRPPHGHDLVRRRRVEALGVDAVLGDVQDAAVGGRDAHQFVGRGLGRHHTQVRTAKRGAGPRAEEARLDRRVQHWVREERRVVQRHDRCGLAGQRKRVVR